MTSDYPTTVTAAALCKEVPVLLPPTPIRTDETGAWHYDGRHNSRAALIAAMVLSAGLHAALLLGIGPPRQKAAAAAPQDTFMIRLAIPEMKDLEEPEVASSDDTTPTPDLGILVPMQADVPQLARPTDFVQQINFASLLEQPDFSKVKVYAVPEHMRSGGKLAEQLGRIFNLADLDRIPEPVLQPAPQFPHAMRREAVTGTVVLEFIVDTQGKVLDPVVIDTTHHGFDDSAMAGVSRWKFRPGFKGGRKVATRMRVPIVFKLLEPLD